MNPRYKDIIIDKSETKRTALQEIPEKLIERAAVVQHESEINIDRLVQQQSAESMPTQGQRKENQVEEQEQISYPMSFLTRAASRNVTEQTTPAIILEGINCTQIRSMRQTWSITSYPTYLLIFHLS